MSSDFGGLLTAEDLTNIDGGPLGPTTNDVNNLLTSPTTQSNGFYGTNDLANGFQASVQLGDTGTTDGTGGGVVTDMSNGTTTLVDGLTATTTTNAAVTSTTGGGGAAIDAIGSERQSSVEKGESSGTSKEGNKVVDYNEAFPALGGGAANDPNGAGPPVNAWTSKPVSKIRSTVSTQLFTIPAEERHSRDDNSFGSKNSEIHECNEIMQKTGTKIELCESKDHSLTIVITGKRQNIEEARKLIVQQIQRQAFREIRIPKEHHRVLIGRDGKRLAELEKTTDCRIVLPNRDTPSEVIRVHGPKEGIDAALHRIQLISDEQSKLAQEALIIPREYYPWIKGPNNERLDQLKQRTGARVNIPPPSAESEIIVVTGEKEGVYAAASEIRNIYEQKRAKCQTLTIPLAKSQHKYVIGPGGSAVAEILRETDVSVEVPPLDSEDASVTLRGEADHFGQAVSLVYAKGSSVLTTRINCPQWLHKFVIGTRGSNIKQVVGEPPLVQVDFGEEDDEDCVIIEGKPDEVRSVKQSLSDIVDNLMSQYSTVVVKVPPSHHRHIIGRSGANIQKIKEATAVLVNIPDESTNSDEIRLEGPKEGVTTAANMIKEIADRLENERSRDILIDQRFHSQLIGSKGSGVKDMKERYPNTNVSFPEPGRKSEVVTLRGPKDEVDSLFKELQTKNKKLVEENFQIKVPIYKEFHRVIIGKGGQNVRKIRDETNTQIDIPPEDSTTDVIVITGRKADAEKAAEMLQSKQNELASIVSIDVMIPNKVHSSLLYNQGRLIHSIQDECGGVQIKFPNDPKSTSDKVIIRGPKDDVERAKVLLTQLAKDKELSSFKASVKVKAEQHRFLIGTGGSSIKKIRDQYPDVRIFFPRANDEDKDTIHLIGRKEDVAKVKTMLEAMVVELENIVESTVDIDPKWHRFFMARQGGVIRDVQDEFGGVNISFPPRNAPAPANQVVKVKGAKECVSGAIDRMKQIVDDLVCEVRVDVEIPQKHHRALLANRGSNIQEICANCKVQIKFPDRGSPNGPQNNQNGPQANGPHSPPTQNGVQQNGVAPEGDKEGGEAQEGGVNRSDIIVVTGRQENCDKARELLNALIPITEEVTVPFDYHRFLIGKAGQDLRKLQSDYNVNVSIPPRDEQRNVVYVSGTKDNLAGAVKHILAKVAEFDDEAQDRELRSFQVKFDMPAEHFPRIIGPKGKTIDALRRKHGVQISLPPPNAENATQITVTGYEDKANACKAEIQGMVADYESLFTQEITLDARIHPRLIGQKGKTIRKIMDDFRVEIRLPRNNDPNPNLVAVCGQSEDDVYDCIDHLRNLEEEYLQDTVDRYRHPVYEARDENRNVTKGGPPGGIAFANAPWSGGAPDTNNMEDFPAVGGAAGDLANSLPVWGPRR